MLTLKCIVVGLIALLGIRMTEMLCSAEKTKTELILSFAEAISDIRRSLSWADIPAKEALLSVKSEPAKSFFYALSHKLGEEKITFPKELPEEAAREISSFMVMLYAAPEAESLAEEAEKREKRLFLLYEKRKGETEKRCGVIRACGLSLSLGLAILLI
ncbi:MAG: hypothetical protein J6D00_04890 [Christensenellaceae bacterium]|nr:hypothetical protein [Christensenellaceae bacterium]